MPVKGNIYFCAEFYQDGCGPAEISRAENHHPGRQAVCEVLGGEVWSVSKN